MNNELRSIVIEISKIKVSDRIMKLFDNTIEQMSIGNYSYSRGITKAVADFPEADISIINIASRLEKIKG